jgi:hypothetical protein
MRPLWLLLSALAFFLAPSVFAQTGPAFVRDHVYGPGGNVIMTAEPDTIPPTAVTNVHVTTDGSWDQTITWTAATDIGSGVAGYYVYRFSTYLGSTTSTSWDDYFCPPKNQSVSYSVKAYDNAGNVGPSAGGSVGVGMCLQRPQGPLAASRLRKLLASGYRFGSPPGPGREPGPLQLAGAYCVLRSPQFEREAIGGGL